MMENYEKEPEPEQVLAAMSRATCKAWKRAAEQHLKVPIWKNGRIIHVDPREYAQQLDSLNPLSAALLEGE